MDFQVSACSKIGNSDMISFGLSPITEIPKDLFDCMDVIPVMRASYMFSSCTNITSIPSNFFDKVDTNGHHQFYEMFSNCINLTGSAPELWNMFPNAEGFSCFYNCTKLDNYEDIPSDWK